MVIREIRLQGMECVYLIRGKKMQQAVVYMVMNFQVSQNEGKALTEQIVGS
jgi:hypothetical protein